MPPQSPHAIRQKAAREARSAAALRANLARRKDQRRRQSTDGRVEASLGVAGSPEGAPDADLAPKGSHR